MTPRQEDRHLRTLTFEAFYDMWFSRGVGWAMRACFLCRQDAEEVASDAMVPVYAGWGVIENPGAYYRVIVHRRAVDKLREVMPQKKAETSVPDSEICGEEPLPREVRDAFTSLMTPESVYEQVEQSRLVLDALDQLSPHLRTSLVMAAEGYTAKERADFKEGKENTERTHLKRARERFSRLLLARGVPHQRGAGEPEATGEPGETGELESNESRAPEEEGEEK
ncbi:RNA polymerase sigma factor [Streptomyces avermitilis]|uniref:RNA polymerase sigma factor n=1 Tax=Streptomyces avermitilis TaxID=33903 RepID=UPI0033CEDB6D